MSKPKYRGYTEYRYGEKRAAPPLKPIYKGAARQHVIKLVMDVLDDWRLTPFENEGACRAELRSNLCLKGNGWDRSDSEARQLVSVALMNMHAERPSWEQGQREYSLPEEYCNWCYVQMPEELRAGARRARFCSAVCAKAALQHRDYETTLRQSAVARSAQSIILRETLPEQQCVQCGKMFKPFNPGRTDVSFCSIACASQSKRKYFERPCKACGKLFQQMKPDNLFCSIACKYQPVHEKTCKQCSKKFVASHGAALFCSRKCSTTYRRAEEIRMSGREYIPAGALIRRTCVVCEADFMTTKQYSTLCGQKCRKRLETIRKAKRLSPHVFDYFFKMAA